MDTKKCPFCGKKNYIDMKFCSNCGKKFEEEEEVVEETMFCPNCGTKNKVGERYCSECGFDLEKESDEDQEEPKEEQDEQEEEEVEEEIMFCPNCGTKNKVGERYCSECGFDLEEEPDENQEEKQKEEEQEKHKKDKQAEKESKKKLKADKKAQKEEKKKEQKERKENKKKEKEEKNSKKPIPMNKEEKKTPIKNKKRNKLPIVVIILLVVIVGTIVSYQSGLLDKYFSNTKEENTRIENNKEWSNWVEKLPKNVTKEKYEIEEKTQYSKKTKDTKVSTTKNLEGWTLYDTKESGEEKTIEVETAKEIKKFEDNDDIEIINKETILEKYEGVLCGYYNPKEGQNRFYTPNSEEPYCSEDDSYTLKDDSGEWPKGTYKVGDDLTHKAYTNSDGQKIYYKVIKVTPYKIKYTYKDSDSKTKYYYYKWSSWSKYQDKEIEENDETKVRTRTVYRYKLNETNTNK